MLRCACHCMTHASLLAFVRPRPVRLIAPVIRAMLALPTPSLCTCRPTVVFPCSPLNDSHFRLFSASCKVKLKVRMLGCQSETSCCRASACIRISNAMARLAYTCACIFAPVPRDGLVGRRCHDSTIARSGRRRCTRFPPPAFFALNCEHVHACTLAGLPLALGSVCACGRCRSSRALACTRYTPFR